jgi:hypothetical protein
MAGFGVSGISPSSSNKSREFLDYLSNHQLSCTMELYSWLVILNRRFSMLDLVIPPERNVKRDKMSISQNVNKQYFKRDNTVYNVELSYVTNRPFKGCQATVLPHRLRAHLVPNNRLAPARARDAPPCCECLVSRTPGSSNVPKSIKVTS